MSQAAPHVPCVEDRPTAGFDTFELRGGRMIVGCKCTRNDGMQHECMRTQCMGRPACLEYPVPACLPSRPCPPEPVEDDRQDNGGAEQRPIVERPVYAAAAAAAAAVGKDRDRSRAAAAHRLRQRAIDQYHDRRARKVPFEPCRVHARKPKADGATKLQ